MSNNEILPYAYICTDKPGFADLSNLTKYRNAPLNEIVSIQLDISKIRDEHGPEAQTIGKTTPLLVARACKIQYMRVPENLDRYVFLGMHYSKKDN